MDVSSKVHVWYEYGLNGFIDLDTRAGHGQKCSKTTFLVSGDKSLIFPSQNQLFTITILSVL